MKRFSFLLILFIAVLSVQGYGKPNDERYLKKVIDKMNLSEQQKKDVEKIHFDMEKQTIAQRAKVATARVDLRQLLKAGTPDKSAIEKKMNELADLGVQLHMIKINSWFAVNTLLNVDQQKQWKKVLENGPEMMRERMMRNRSFRPHPMGHPGESPMPHDR